MRCSPRPDLACFKMPSSSSIGGGDSRIEVEGAVAAAHSTLIGLSLLSFWPLNPLLLVRLRDWSPLETCGLT